MKRYYIIEGDETSVGGIVQRHTGSAQTTKVYDKIVSNIGDKINCSACGSVGTIEAVGYRQPFGNHSNIPAMENDICICKCSPPPILKHSQELFSQDVEYTFNTPDVSSHISALSSLNNCDFNLSVQLVDKENVPHRRKAYFAVSETGEIFEGTTDVDGYTTPIDTESQENISFHLLENYEYPNSILNEDL